MTRKEREREDWFDRVDGEASPHWVDTGVEAIWDAAWESAINAAISSIPGGSVIDPQYACDELRKLLC